MKPGLVAIGALLTIVGVVTLLVPAFPFICIGALIFGPIMLFQGLVARDRPRPMYAPPTMDPSFYPPAPALPMAAAPPADPGTDATAGTCPNCGSPLKSGAHFCTQCGAALPGNA